MLPHQLAQMANSRPVRKAHCKSSTRLRWQLLKGNVQRAQKRMTGRVGERDADLRPHSALLYARYMKALWQCVATARNSSLAADERMDGKGEWVAHALVAVGAAPAQGVQRGTGSGLERLAWRSGRALLEDLLCTNKILIPTSTTEPAVRRNLHRASRSEQAPFRLRYSNVRERAAGQAIWYNE